MCVDIICHSKEGAAAKLSQLENKEAPHEHISHPLLVTGVSREQQQNSGFIE
jgi:hypothetical protein